MGFMQTANKRYLYYDLAVGVPYDKTAEEEVTFYVRWVPVIKRTETSPEEGGHWETVHIKGFYYDDDLPDLEELAFALANDVAQEINEARR